MTKRRGKKASFFYELLAILPEAAQKKKFFYEAVADFAHPPERAAKDGKHNSQEKAA